LDGYVETHSVAAGDVFSDLFSLTGYGYSYADNPAYQHCSANRRDAADITFQLTLSGFGVFEKDGVTEKLTPGRGFLCDIRNDPSYRYYYPEDANEPWRFVYFQFRGATAFEISRRLISTYGNVYVLSTDLPLLSELPACGNGHKTILMSGSQSSGIVQTLLREIGASAERGERNVVSEQIVQKVFGILDRGGRQPTINELANECGVTREHLSRVFMRIVGESANDYLHARILEKIVNQLSFSDKPIKDIAASLGFGSVNTMLRMFRDRVGQYPSLLRNEIRNKKDRKR